MKVWTPEQEKIFEAGTKRGAPMVIEAVAGSGKTSTMVELAKRLKNSLFLAFNKSIAEEISDRHKLEARTFHSFGFRICSIYARNSSSRSNNLTVDNKLAYKTMETSPQFYGIELAEADGDPIEEAKVAKQIGVSAKLATAIKEYGVDVEADTFTRDNVIMFGFEVGAIPSTLFVAPPGVIERITDCAMTYARLCRAWDVGTLTFGKVDFADMLYVANSLVERGLVDVGRALRSLVGGPCSVVFVDEAQDLNPIQHSLIRKIGEHARVIAVGDTGQAIYGFRGACHDSMSKTKAILKQQFGSVIEEDLSICFRCPSSHVELAARFRPGIHPFKDAIEGHVEVVDDVVTSVESEFTKSSNCLVISRLKAPLMGLALRLLARKVPVRCQNRDITERLRSDLSSFKSHEGVQAVFDKLERKYGKVIERLSKRCSDDNAMEVEAITDWIGVLESFLIHSSAATVGDVIELANELSSQAAGGAVDIMTVHRAKGLEADNVWLLNYEQLPFSWPDIKPEEQQQEVNLAYVAYTRSKRNLFLCRSMGKQQRKSRNSEPNFERGRGYV